MSTCPNCHKELEDGTAFCTECGAKIVETVFCVNCGNQTTTEFAFCQNCGASLAQDAEPAQPEKKKFSIPGKWLKLGAIALAVILVLVVAISLIAGSGEKLVNYAVYVQDGELFYSDFSGKPWQATKKLEDEEGKYGIGAYVTVSRDGKTLFFPDKVDEKTMLPTIYFRKIDSKKEAVKISDDVVRYEVNETASKVTYIKADDNEYVLYQYDVNKKKSTKIEDGVASGFTVSPDGKAILFGKKDDDSITYYVKYSNKKEPTKIAADVNVRPVDEDLKEFYYIEEEEADKENPEIIERDLFYWKSGKEAKKIASDVGRFVIAYENGHLYYTTVEYEKDKDTGYVDTNHTLCYYNGKKSVELIENYNSAMAGSTEKEVLVVNTAEMKEGKKDENGNPGETTTEYEYFVVVKGKKTQLDVEEIAGALVSENGKTVYYAVEEKKKEDTDSDDESELPVETPEAVPEYTLFQVKISGSKPGKAKEYDTEVNDIEELQENGKLVYWKDVKNVNPDEGGSYTKGTLIVDKKQVAEDALVDYLEIEEGKFYFVTDYSAKKDEGTLMYWKSGKAKKVAEDVDPDEFQATEKGNLVYRTDISKSGKGDLYFFKGSKPKKIAEDVQYFYADLR